VLIFWVDFKSDTIVFIPFPQTINAIGVVINMRVKRKFFLDSGKLN